MKLEENKHDHKLTNWLKVGIFSILMLAPLLASVSQWLYATVNKNAYQSYSNNNNLQLVEDFNNLQINEKYYFSLKNYEYANDSNKRIYFTNLTDFTNTYNSINYETVADCDSFTTTYYSPSSYVVFYKNNVQIAALRPNISFSFELINVTYNNTYTYEQEFDSSIYKYNNYKSLDNAFYYGVDQMTKSDLFNWTENTALYTGIKAMTDNLQIQTNAIAILITYWFILTIIYVIIDIVLKMFTFITHILSAKM